jgi:hypothetical protein
MWPVVRLAHESGANRILKNVIGFIAEGFVVTETMFEEVTLPFDFEMVSGPTPADP